MKSVFFALVAALLLLPMSLPAQTAKKKIDHTVFDSWKLVRAANYSSDGKVITYEIQPQSGDGYLYVYRIQEGKLDSIARGYEARFIDGSNLVLCKVKPAFAATRKAKLAKKKEDDLPKDSVALYHVEQGKVIAGTVMVKSISGKEECKWYAVHHSKMPEPAATGKKKKKKKPAPEIKSEGTWLELVNTTHVWKKADPKAKKTKNSTISQYRFQHVTEYTLSKKGERFAFVQQRKVGKTDSAYITVFDTQKGIPTRIHSVAGFCKALSFDEKGEQLAFLSSTDTSKNKVYDLWYWKNGHNAPSLLVDASHTAMPKDWCVSENGTLRFSENGSRLYFGTAEKPQKEIKDTLTEDEKYKLDVWSWTDTRIQPEQLKQLDRDKKKNYLAVYHLNTSKMIQLADKEVEFVRTNQEGNGTLALGISEAPYERSKTWEYPIASDYYSIDINTGEKKLILKDQKFYCDLSNAGNYLLYYKRKDDNWYALEIASGKTINLTEKITEDFFDDDNGNPSEEDAQGIAGWSENDGAVYLNGKYDIWKVDPRDPSKPVCLTKNFGRETKTVFRYTELNPEAKFISENDMLLRSFNERTKKAGYYRANLDGKTPAVLLETDHKYPYILKSKNSDKTVFARMNFLECPDLWISDMNLQNIRRISNSNPQQSEYNWGTVRLTNWKTPKGRQLDGLLYLPEDFDSTKKYPLLVYFYEKYADDIHNYYSPRPSASIINPSEYCSNGYVVFIPDILYNEGTPGEDAYDCIISGTNHIVSKGFINKERMGLQGQSWGGYQTAYLVTQTNMYRAAMAGAPVSNMTSAYGGIRWGTGLSRTFQYEKGQSRLGVTLWEDRERYIKNSPLFFADKVNTPLLIMHNDRDGAVPWYQGIEYFNALRRLDKPVWMLNYNDDDHNLTRRANQKDLSIRMRQFFDHYLLDAPMPVWMKDGLPAIDKGKRTGYELEK
ncbi:MAG: alpha/beta hydrolase family protein [Flavobacteriales bacterium]